MHTQDTAVQKRMDTLTHGHGRTSAHPPRHLQQRRGQTHASCSAPARACPALSTFVLTFHPSAVSISLLTAPSVPLDPCSIRFPAPHQGFGAGLGMELWWRQRQADAEVGLRGAGLGSEPVGSSRGQELGSLALNRSAAVVRPRVRYHQRMLLARSGSAPAPALALRQL